MPCTGFTPYLPTDDKVRKIYYLYFVGRKVMEVSLNIIKDISYSNSYPNNVLDIYLPNCKEFSVFICFHGGGLSGGDKAFAKVFAEYLNQMGVAVVSANYRKYPDAKYPEFIQDAAEAVSWTYKNINNYGKCNRFYVGGSSAGAYISMMLCFNKSFLAQYRIDENAIDGYIHDAGQPTCHFNVLHERGIDTRRVIVDELSPLYYVGTEKSYPPMLFVVSDNDIEGRYEQTKLMLSTLKRFEIKNIFFKVMHGTHSQYVGETNKNSESTFGKVIFEFINVIEDGFK